MEQKSILFIRTILLLPYKNAGVRQKRYSIEEKSGSSDSAPAEIGKLTAG